MYVFIAASWLCITHTGSKRKSLQVGCHSFPSRIHVFLCSCEHFSLNGIPPYDSVECFPRIHARVIMEKTAYSSTYFTSPSK